jgi:outer membrane protein assembly factor BamB
MDRPPGPWGYSESPLVDGDQVVVTPGGTGGVMMAFDKQNGKPVWRSKELPGEAAYSSIMPAEIGGVRQYVQTVTRGLDGGTAGIAAKDGKLLWYKPNKRYHDTYAMCPTPIVRGDLVYVTAGYSAGCNLYKITKQGNAFKAEEQYPDEAQRLMVNDHGGVVLVGEYLFGNSDTKGWVCQDLKTGKEMWSNKRKLEGKGSLTCAGNRLYLLSENSEESEAVLLNPSPKGWEEHGRFKLPLAEERLEKREARPSSRSAGVWTHPVVANGRLYLRDQEFIFCYDVKAK